MAKKTFLAALLVAVTMLGFSYTQVGAQTIQRSYARVGRMLVGDGSVGAPSMAFASHPGTGWYWISSDNIVGAQGGSGAMLLNNALLRINATTVLGWSSGNVTGAVEDTTLTRSGAGKLTLAGTTPMLQFGGTTSSFPSLKQVGSSFNLRLADDSGNADLGLKQLFTGTSTNTLLLSSTAPTISSGFGTSPSIANSNGTTAFTVNVGSGAVATSGVIGLPAATTGWNCYVSDRAATDHPTRETATTTNTVTLTAASAWGANDILQVSCFAY